MIKQYVSFFVMLYRKMMNPWKTMSCQNICVHNHKSTSIR